MNIQQLILLSIGSTSLSGCIGGTSCKNTGFEFEDRQSDVTEAHLNNVMVEKNITDVNSVTCEDLCAEVGGSDNYSSYIVESCSQDIDVTLFEQESGDTGDDSQVVGTVTCSGEGDHYCEGRRPLGFQNKECAYFARSAHLEASSVVAFQQLIDQLRRWKAPQNLIDRAIKAAEDEVRHATQMTRLANLFGQEIPEVSLDSVIDQGIFIAALHNATEGCVFETWAALEATLKSRFATTVELRDIYTEIARDEIGHAQLSWDLHQWFKGQLSEQQCNLIDQAQRKALQELQNSALNRLAQAPTVLGLDQVLDGLEIVNRFSSQIA